ncbi:MAG: DUF5615 family PIN-like protein [Chloroflexota bacterium]|nr:DUF5615 family PIN-like protein [Chloroflexota bacterium]
MLRLAADENFDGDVLKAVLRRLTGLDLIRVQDTKLYEKPDPDVLDWAAHETRVLLTHDARTMIGHAWDRVRRGLPMPGLIVVKPQMQIGTAVDELEYVIIASRERELENQVLFIPMQPKLA